MIKYNLFYIDRPQFIIRIPNYILMKKLSTGYAKHLTLINNEQDKEGSNFSTSTFASHNEIYNQELFSTSDIIGNFDNAFIITHNNSRLYLIDQHAASQKSLYIQLLKGNNLFPINYAGPPLQIQNIYFEVLEQKKNQLEKLGWFYKLINKGPIYSLVQLQMVPSLIGKISTPDDFIQIVEQLYTEQAEEYSRTQKQSLASTACHSAFRVGHELKKSQMRGLVDSLGKMEAAFNCPHGRPTIICLGRVENIVRELEENAMYTLE